MAFKSVYEATRKVNRFIAKIICPNPWAKVLLFCRNASAILPEQTYREKTYTQKGLRFNFQAHIQSFSLDIDGNTISEAERIDTGCWALLSDQIWLNAPCLRSGFVGLPTKAIESTPAYVWLALWDAALENSPTSSHFSRPETSSQRNASSAVCLRKPCCKTEGKIHLVRDAEALHNLRSNPTIPDAPLSQHGLDFAEYLGRRFI